MFAPSVERPWRDAWPPVAQVGDGNAWLTGACWLYCRREGVAVLWVGSVAAPGATGDVYACGPCLAELDHMVRLQAHGRDGYGDHAVQSATLAVPAHVPPPRALPAGAVPAAVTGHRAGDLPRTPQHCRRGGAMTATRTCEHRQTEKRDGKTYCRDCKRQIYL
ncbi:hypothetical protein SSP531S_47130 [Streptomyces spongiicola]|uniref:Uncharacterized protein n=1 Tax=Streptomyces spongiicola TaxID=1690221 RepID=A0A388T2U2_9ACTN|nr:hypothetical protein [Streptomyces spongiicola]GBQ03243.1 hypothetical protein SSP531S_47130 [Streptomyces spongiicola]